MGLQKNEAAQKKKKENMKREQLYFRVRSLYLLK